MIIKIIGIIVLLYVFGFIVTPNHLFFTKIRKTKRLEQIVKKFKSKNKEDTLRKTQAYIIKNFSRETYNFILQGHKLFYSDVEKLLQKKQFAQCTLQNLILITLLVNTNQFKESDFKRKWKIINWIVPHQYVIVSMGNKVFEVDPLLGRILLKKKK